ncbi:MAG: hypothetical protein ACRC1W_01235 [Shewanella sp.]
MFEISNANESMAKLKYKIDHHLSLQPRNITMDSIVKVLAEHGISRDTFYRDRNLTIDDTFSIPSNRLDTYAALLNTTTDDLKNYPAKKIKPLSERKQSTLAKKIIKKGNLIKGK